MIGISIKSTIGLGDGLQFSSLPENYYRATGKHLYDISRPWFFDFNPFVDRDSSVGNLAKIEKRIEMWNYSPRQYDWPKLRPQGVYLSNAEIHASVLGVPVALNRPRLYQFENIPFAKREMILLHTDGVSHKEMPKHVIEHVIAKYGSTGRLFQIGTKGGEYGIPKIETPTRWDLAAVIAQARMLIGVDSGPSWIAAAFPDVVTKVVRTKQSADVLSSWVPLDAQNIHSHWDDRSRGVYNVTDHDVGFTWSYRRL